jgi:sugar O-acyltransferase (sialic acid O-acetyltransferase NeuD family)
MTIIGKSKAAFAMICDAITSQPHTYSAVKILNNLGLPEKFSYPKLPVSEIESLSNDIQYVLGAVMPGTKKILVEKFKVHYQKLINASAQVSPAAQIGDGTIIDGLAFISSGAKLGKYVTIYSASTVAHDSILGDYVTICPNVAVCGEVEIGEGTFIGAGAVIKNGITIGKDCTIGAGSVVIENVPDNIVTFGNPSKPKI